MTELKTLKDLPKYNKGGQIAKPGAEERFVDLNDLRQGTIKCFKELEKLKKSHYFDKNDFFQNNFQENPVVVLRFLEWFFNIKEEDLK